MKHVTILFLLAPAILIGCSKPDANKQNPSQDKISNASPQKGEVSPQKGEAGTTGVKVINPNLSLDTGMEKGPSSIRISSDGKLLLARGFGKEKTVQIWDLETKEKRFVLDKPTLSETLPAAMSPDGKTAALAMTSPVPSIVLIDLANAKELRRLEKKGERQLSPFMECLVYSPQGDLLVVGTAGTSFSDSEIIGWGATTGEQRFAWTNEKDLSALSNFFDDGKKIAASYRSQPFEVKIWDVPSAKLIQTLKISDDPGHRVRGIAASSDGKKLATVHTLGRAKIWDVASGKLLMESEPEIVPEIDTNVLFLPDNKTIVFGGHGPPESKSNIYLVNVNTGKVTHRLEGHTNGVTQVSVTLDGNTLVSGSKDKTIKTWSLK